MNTKFAVGLLVVLGSLVFYRIGHPMTHFVADGMDPDWDSAVESRDTSKPTVVFFTATWCPYCQELATGVLAQPEVESYLDHHYNFHVVECSTVEGGARAHKFGINAFPTLIRYAPDGHETGRINNSTEERLMDWFKAGE